MLKIIQTGLLWITLKDLTEGTIENIKNIYSYPHPYEEGVIFETYMLLKDRIGIPFGNLPKANSFLHGFTIEDRRIAPPLDKPFTFNLKLREYQEVTQKNILQYLEAGGTAFNLSGKPGSGKSVMLASLIAKLNVKTLIIAHMSMLTTQLAQEFSDNTNADVQVLSASSKELKDVNIATSQFISKNPTIWKQIKENIGCIVVDEAESLASLTTLRIFQRAHARYHFALSATFTRSVDHRTNALQDIIGNKVFTLENKHLLVPKVTMVKCPEVYPPFINKMLSVRQKQAFYRKESIMTMVMKLVAQELFKGRQILVACDIQAFQNALSLNVEGVGVLASGVSKKRRAQILKDFHDGELKVLCAGMVVNAGLSIPKITTIIRVSFPSSPEKNVQLIGRALRDFDGKQGAFIYDLVFKGKNPSKRLAAYKANGYQIDIKTIEEVLDGTT